MCDDTNINYPAQPTYGEGLADALKAQANLLRGTGDFAATGSLAELLPLEREVREKSAQMDTDILRKTLLGQETTQRVVQDPETGRFGIPDGQVVERDPSTGRYQVVSGAGGREDGNLQILDTNTGAVVPDGEIYAQLGWVEKVGPQLVSRKLDGRGNYQLEGYKLTPAGIAAGVQLEPAGRSNTAYPGFMDAQTGQVGVNPKGGLASPKQVSQVFKEFDNPAQVTQTFTFVNPNTGEEFKPTEAGETITTRKTTGMLDLLGDTRNLRDEQRRAGFDEQGNFLGLAALTEDIGTEQLTRRRERDLADVERLAPRYKDVMDVFRDENLMTSIGEVGGMQDVFMRDMAEQRAGEADDTEAAPITAKDNPYQYMLNSIMEDQQSDLAQLAEQEAGGRVFDPNMTAETINNEYLMRLDQLNKAFPEQAQGVAGDVGDAGPMGDAGDPFTARLAQAGTPQGAGLRETLTNEALLGLQDRLTPREEYQIAEAARARATMMGRTFDQSEAIREAQARVLEDNQRRMQNRAFAQNVLGQEAGTRFRELALRQQNQLDPFTAILGRPGAPTTGQAQSILGQAGYGLESGPQYLNPEAGLGFISQMAANEANIAGAQAAAKGSARAGMFQGLGSLGGGILAGAGFCWVAREVYGMHNPAWLLFREWMLNESPSWFRAIYIKFGERFAKFISDKPRIKARIRLWMDTKIRR